MSLAGADWAGSRGEKWCAHLAGTEATFAPVDEPLIRALQLDEPCRIADIACGGGGTTLEILRRAPEGSVVHGLDISPALIERARSRLRPGERAIAFERVDMVTAPVPVEPYGRLSSRFGVLFFPDPPVAFARLLRWLVPGGRFVFAVWGPPAENPWISSVREVVARFVDVPAIEPDAPGPFRYAGADRLLDLLEGAGFRGLEVRDWRGAFSIGGGLPPARAASFALASFASFGELLAAEGDAALAGAHRELTALFGEHCPHGAVRMDACVHLLTGARP